jgi:hypothetical protein
MQPVRPGDFKNVRPPVCYAANRMQTSGRIAALQVKNTRSRKHGTGEYGTESN